MDWHQLASQAGIALLVFGLIKLATELGEHWWRSRSQLEVEDVLTRETPALGMVTPVDRSRDGFWRQVWIALSRTSPAFQPVASPRRPAQERQPAAGKERNPA